MTVDDKIKDEKMQNDIKRKAAKISALSSWKIDKYEYVTGVETLSSDQSRIIEKANFTYSPLSKAFEKTNKNNWRSRKKTNKGTWRAWEITS